MKRKNWILGGVCLLLVAAIAANFFVFANATSTKAKLESCVGDKYIKWVEFDPPYSALEKALKLDIDTYEKEPHISWIDVLAYLSASYWGEWSRYKGKDMDALAEKLANGEQIEQLAEKYEYFNYYREAYTAVLGGLVGEYQIATEESLSQPEPIYETKYGLKGYSPIAYGYSFSHYKDFGASRSYGYGRPHLGNDLMSNVGSPVMAVESGIITNLGWNQYGGWRVGIRSLDGKRYYYYAHLRKDHPYAEGITEGKLVNAGDIIGYVGMTGYSTTENVNGMKQPHLHFGLQLVFDESQLEGENEIWVDVYSLVSLLEKHKSPVLRDEGEKDYRRKYPFIDPCVEEYLQQHAEVEPGDDSTSQPETEAETGTD